MFLAIMCMCIGHIPVASGQEGSLSDGYNFLSAIKDQNYSKVRSYIQKGVNVNTRDYDDGVTGLYLATKMKDRTMARFLLQAKADTDRPKESTGETPLMVSTLLKDHDMMSLLIGQRCNVNISDRNGETALYKSVRANDMEGVRILMKAKADWSIADNTGRTPLDISRENRRLNRITKILEDAGAEY